MSNVNNQYCIYALLIKIRFHSEKRAKCKRERDKKFMIFFVVLKETLGAITISSDYANIIQAGIRRKNLSLYIKTRFRRNGKEVGPSDTPHKK